jgi:hypothetical protein
MKIGVGRGIDVYKIRNVENVEEDGEKDEV